MSFFYRMSQKPILVNRIVALSNVIGCMFVLTNPSSHVCYQFKVGHLLAIIACTLSYIYHLCETKHGQPLMAGFTQEEVHRNLDADRFGAVVCAIYCLYALPSYSNEIMGLGIVGLVCLGISESRLLRDRLFLGRHVGTLWVFCLFHSIWHLCAFSILARATASDTFILRS